MPDSNPLAESRTAQSPVDALKRAVAILGGQSKTARFLDLSQTSIWKWVSKGKVLPAEYVLKVEAATGISRHDLRPDIYPREIPASQPSPIPDGRTTVCNAAASDPLLADPHADGGEAARSMSCDHLDRAADTESAPPPIGKAAA